MVITPATTIKMMKGEWKIIMIMTTTTTIKMMMERMENRK